MSARAARQRALVALGIGALFGAGLALGGMTDPRVVLGFLDLAGLRDGTWDPRLLYVMGGGLFVSTLGVWLARRRGRPLLADAFRWPTASALDVRLIGGALLFGIGWGVAGYCPGPGLAALVVNPAEALVFVPALLAGSWLAKRFAQVRET